MLAVSRQLRIRNRILGALPHEELAHLLPHLEEVNLEKGDTVYLTGDAIQYAYFPEKGLFSLVSTTETGSTIEVAMIGREGGLPVILRNHQIPYEVSVQCTTVAHRIRAQTLQEEFDKGQTLHELMLRYLNVLFAQIAQLLICSRFHTLDATLSRWLLTVQDRVNSDHLDLTHENISNSLGAPRTAVTMAAGTLQRAGIIRYSRGKILILDRAGLETRSCECYRIIRDEVDHFLKRQF